MIYFQPGSRYFATFSLDWWHI